MLPFFILASLVVYFWASLNYGDLAALLAVALFSSTPVVLAFSSLEYTDFPAAATQLLALFAFARWLETRNTRWAVGLGVAVGLAIAPIAMAAFLGMKKKTPFGLGTLRDDTFTFGCLLFGTILIVGALLFLPVAGLAMALCKLGLPGIVPEIIRDSMGTSNDPDREHRRGAGLERLQIRYRPG